jgi:hypothetical protein
VLYNSTEDNAGKAKWDACRLNISPPFNVQKDITGDTPHEFKKLKGEKESSEMLYTPFSRHRGSAH